MRKTGNWRVKAISLAVSVLLILPGCMADYGRLKSNPDLTDVFTNKLALPEYNYYYCGRDNLPYAVVGIDPKYEFQDRVWHKIETKEEVYKKAAALLALDDIWSRGADILDPTGNRIGIWFSYYQHTTVKVGPENKVWVYNPYSPSRHSADTARNAPP